MHEQVKIEEARYFLGQLFNLRNDRVKFKHTLSAFLTAARSALQYACKEAKPKPGGTAWYNGQVTDNAIVAFLRDERDVNIHEEPITPTAQLNVTAGDVSRSSAGAIIAVLRADGAIEIRKGSSQPGSSLLPTLPDVKLTAVYSFADWPGSEDVLNLGEMYLQEIERIVADGIAKGFLTK